MQCLWQLLTAYRMHAVQSSLSSLPSLSSSQELRSACFWDTLYYYLKEQSEKILSSHVPTLFYFEGHHIIMVIHRSKLCKIKARYAGIFAHGPGLLWPIVLVTCAPHSPGAAGCCHHTSAAQIWPETIIPHPLYIVTLSRDWLITARSNGTIHWSRVITSWVPQTQ